MFVIDNRFNILKSCFIAIDNIYVFNSRLFL